MTTLITDRMSFRAACGAALLLMLSACGGGGGSEAAAPAPVASGPGTGTLSASITDAALDDVTAVNLRVTALQLREQGAAEGDWVVIDLRDALGNALQFNLLDYQHGATFALFEDERVPAGVYEHARLVLEAPARTPVECRGQDPLAGSHVEAATGGLVPLFIPSGANAGVRLVSPFRVPLNGSADIVIDFDLRQSLHQPAAFRNQCFFLRPAFRVEAVQNTGRITGTVDAELLDGSNGFCSDDDPMTGNAVYVYAGADQLPGDLNADPDATTAAPVATSSVEYDALFGNSGGGTYTVAFLPPGDYTVAFTCRADQERLPNPDGTSDDERFAVDELDFQAPQTTTVTARATSVVDFSAALEE
ncbi:MAG: DUF4382 domain-containing protein [Pseudomonadales bacterium]|nr:DUF4382 domain-containing protein [Pseudomonadales bacterium]